MVSSLKPRVTSETHNSTKYYVHDEPSDMTQTEPISSLSTKNMTIKNYAVDDNA